MSGGLSGNWEGETAAEKQIRVIPESCTYRLFSAGAKLLNFGKLKLVKRVYEGRIHCHDWMLLGFLPETRRLRREWADFLAALDGARILKKEGTL